MRHYKSLVALGIVFVIGTLIWINWYSIYDYWRLAGYSPPSSVASLANQDTMTPYARNLFYVYHPQIEESAPFNQNCKVTDQTIVLGCTIIGQGIYLYNVTDPALNGVEQATAAYEMLHVAYSRLNSSERTYIDGLVQAAYNQAASTNTVIKNEVASYYTTEGAAAVPNELHSVVGTEIAKLSPALEKYYSKYFTNRQTVVSYTTQYENVFSQRQTTVASDDQQLSEIKGEINSNEATLSSELPQLNQLQAELNSERSAGDISSYNNSVPTFNSMAEGYNSLLVQTKNLISQYNQLVIERNSVAFSEDQLIQSISSYPVSTAN